MNTEIKFAALMNGMTVITSTSKEEMELINTIVDNGFGNDVRKDYISDGVFSFTIISKEKSIQDSVAALKAKGIDVKESEDYTSGNANTTYFILASDYTSDMGLNLSPNVLISNGSEIAILDVKA